MVIMSSEMSENPEGVVTGYRCIFDPAGRLYLIPAINLEDRPKFAAASMIYDSTGRRISPLRTADPQPLPPLELRRIDTIARIKQTVYRNPTPVLHEFGGGPGS